MLSYSKCKDICLFLFRGYKATSGLRFVGISILFSRPESDPPKLFSFLEPLDNKIWMCMIGAYAVVSIFLFVVARYVCMRFCMQGRIDHPRPQIYLGLVGGIWACLGLDFATF